MTDRRIFPPEYKRRLDLLTGARVSRTVSKPADASAPRPHPVITDPLQWQDHGDGMEPNIQEMGTPVAEQQGNTFSFSPVGLPEQFAREEQLDSAFDLVRPEMHAQYLACLAANRKMCAERKQQMECSLIAAIAAHLSHCPSCGSNEVCAQGLPVTVVWVGLAYRFELSVPISQCSLCESVFSVNPLQLNCMPATAVQSWDLRKAVYGSRPIWFDMDLLQVRDNPGMPVECKVYTSSHDHMRASSGMTHTRALQAVDTEMCVIKRQSMDRRCDVLMRLHQHSGCESVLLSYDTLRKRLSEAVRELGYLLAANADFPIPGCQPVSAGAALRLWGLLESGTALTHGKQCCKSVCSYMHTCPLA